MRNTIKKFLASILAATIVITSIPVSAENTENEHTFNDSCTNYIESTLPEILYALGCDDINSCYATNYFPIYDCNENETGRYISFIVRNNTIIGDFTFNVNNNGDFSSSAGLQSYPDINNALQKNQQIALFCIDDELVMLENTNYSSRNLINFQSIELNVELNFTNPRITYYNYRTGTPIVGQGDRGTCWAACVASKIMCDTGASGLDADVVYDRVISVYGSIGSRRTRYQRGLESFGFTMDTSFSGLKNFLTLKQKTENRNVVIMRLSNTGNENGDIHAVVLEGYVSAHSSGGTYLIMDPNYSGYRGIPINSSIYNGTSGFTYTSAIGDFTWIDSLCKS